MTPNVKTRLEGMAMKARYNNTKENLMFANVGQQPGVRHKSPGSSKEVLKACVNKNSEPCIQLGFIAVRRIKMLSLCRRD